MARTCIKRCVCKEPLYTRFKTINGSNESLNLTVDEYETIRCIDLNKMTQDDTAKIMKVARTTVQAIYNSARFKIANFLINGKNLEISGGEYYLCDGINDGCPHQEYCRKLKEGLKMRIAVTYENGNVFQHFGKTEEFKIYNVNNGVVESSEVVSTNGKGHGALAGLLVELGADVLICGGLGGGAVEALKKNGIKLVAGTSGNCDELVNKFLKNELALNDVASCNHHHDHDENHECHCGNHHHEGNCNH